MKLPNGYGSVTKLSGNRRKPYVAREGISGRQKPIGYAATKEEALMILADYNKNPWDIENTKVTFEELYNLWLKKRAEKLGKSNKDRLKAAYNYCEKLNNLKYNSIKTYQMQDCIDSCGKSYSMQGAIKNLFYHLDRFAMELDIINKRNSDLLTTAPTPETSRTVFSDEEIDRLWDNQYFPWVDSVLFFLYTGFRISEALELKIGAVDLTLGTMTGGTKTEAGKNRIVPIHSKIIPIVQKRYEQSTSGYLFEYQSKKVSQTQYRQTFWADIMKTLQMNHTPHECRHTFRSRLDSAGANKVCIDRIMGHKSEGTGERVYTHKTIEELKESIELIKK